MKQPIYLLVLFMLLPVALFAQENNLHHQSSTYQWPTDPQVKEKLDKWQDQKFGVLILSIWIA